MRLLQIATANGASRQVSGTLPSDTYMRGLRPTHALVVATAERRGERAFTLAAYNDMISLGARSTPRGRAPFRMKLGSPMSY